MIREKRKLISGMRLAVLALAAVTGFSLYHGSALSVPYETVRQTASSRWFREAPAPANDHKLKFAGTSLTPSEPQGPDQNYSTFKHSSARHASLGCMDCHKRPGDNSIRPVFPYHPACINCHGNQFLTPGSSMCTICHSDMSGTKPPLKGFPTTFKESFNLKFDHSQHMTGSAKPKNGCVACHNRPLNRGAALSIPAGPSAHSQCYTCHTPGSKSGSGREIASCSVCHATQKYARTSTNSRAFRQAFSHAQHGPRQRLDCGVCHTLSPGVALGRQVSSTRATQHFSSGGRSCTSCHDGQRSFGGDLDFKGCRRCHTGTSFRFPT